MDNNNTLKVESLKIIRLVIGLFVFALGTVCILNARIGVGPWDIFHQGLSNLTGITVGQASILMGILIVGLDIYLGQPIGFATITNMILIGSFIDLLMFADLIPKPQAFLPSLILLIAGIFLHGIAVFLYIAVGWGAGPRDGLMVVLVRKTGKSVRLIKTSIEFFAAVGGYLLGGNLGVGTLIVAFLSGPIWQFIFQLLKFNIDEVEHISIQEHLKLIKTYISER